MQNPSCFSQGVRQGEAGMAWLRKFGLRQVRSGKAGAAWLGVVWFCCVRYGGVRRGRLGGAALRTDWLGTAQ